MQSIWTLVTIAGPIIFLAGLIWAVVRNKQQSTPESEALTERATKIQREAQAAENEEIGGPLG